MREFILLSLKGPTQDPFKLKDRTETGLICRTVANCLWVSKGIRRDTIVHVVLNGGPNPPRIVTFVSNDLPEKIPFDEVGLADLFSKVLKEGRSLVLGEKKEVMPGVSVAKKSFEELVKERSEIAPLYYLHEKGKDVRTIDFSEHAIFVFGDLFGIPANTEKLLARLATNRIKLGPYMLFASHCPILVHNEFDRKEKGMK